MANYRYVRSLSVGQYIRDDDVIYNVLDISSHKDGVDLELMKPDGSILNANYSIDDQVEVVSSSEFDKAKITSNKLFYVYRINKRDSISYRNMMYLQNDKKTWKYSGFSNAIKLDKDSADKIIRSCERIDNVHRYYKIIVPTNQM